VWGHDFTRFTRARRVAIAVLDLVSRYWIATLTSVAETSEQVTAVYTIALEDQGLLAEAERRMLIAPNGDEALPILVAWSDIHTAWCRRLAVPACGPIGAERF
jgi:putative transposase